jgi:hypothetical protein
MAALCALGDSNAFVSFAQRTHPEEPQLMSKVWAGFRDMIDSLTRGLCNSLYNFPLVWPPLQHLVAYSAPLSPDVRCLFSAALALTLSWSKFLHGVLHKPPSPTARSFS